MAKPVYQQVKTELLDLISQQESNTAIPSERALSQKFNVSRMTLRKAVNELVDEGVLYRDTTRGTFVSEKGLIKKNSLRPSHYSRHLLYMTRRVFKDIAPILEIPVYEDLLRFVSKHNKDERVAYIDEIYVSKRRYMDDYQDIDHVFEAIESKDEFHIHQTFYPILVPVQFANLMEIALDRPIIMVESLYRTKKGEPIFLTKTFYNPEVETIEISN